MYNLSDFCYFSKFFGRFIFDYVDCCIILPDSIDRLLDALGLETPESSPRRKAANGAHELWIVDMVVLLF